MERGRKGGEDGEREEGRGRWRREDEKGSRGRGRRDTYWRKCVQSTGTSTAFSKTTKNTYYVMLPTLT